MERPVVFRINDGIGPELLQQVFLERGWVEYNDEVHRPDEWSLWWKTSRFRTGEYSSLLPWQHINHFPSTSVITKKDALCRNLRKMKVAHGLHVYNFSPKAFNLPNDYTKFVSEYTASKQRSGPKDVQPTMWICKPAESSRGRGIFIFTQLSELQYDCNAVVQHYISNPLLIGGYKFDIRVYVAVPSFNPLHIYVHEEGLVRFSTEKYDLGRPDNVFSHLTNTSINKFSPGYTTDKEEVGHGCKWTISQLRRYFHQNSINDTAIWRQITNIIVLTILMQAPTAPKMNNCFELYGFDVLIDTNLKAWLLEVNFSPALTSDCHADIVAKKSMLHDLMTLVHVHPAASDASPSPSRSISDTRVANPEPDTARTAVSAGSRNSQCSGNPLSVKGSNSRHRLSPNNAAGASPSNNNNNGVGSRRRKPANANNKTNGSSHPPDERKSKWHSPNCTDDDSHPLPKAETGSAMASATDRSHPGKHDMSNGGAAGLSSDRRDFSKRRSLPDINGNSSENNSGDREIDVISILGLHKQSVNSCNNSPPLGNVNKAATHKNADACGTENFNDDRHFQTESIPSQGDQFGNLRDPETEFPSGHTSGEQRDHTSFTLDNDFGFIIVRGDMKGQGQKCTSCSNTPMALNGHRDKQTKLDNLSKPRRQPKLPEGEERSFGKNGPNWNKQQHAKAQPPSSRSNSSQAAGDSWNSNGHRVPLARNWSRLDNSRLPQNPTNYLSPGKNGVAPLARIPPKRVGKLFLVFPFNEATQKMTLADNLNTKMVIKEVLRNNVKSRKADAEEDSSQDVSVRGGIWSSISSAP